MKRIFLFLTLFLLVLVSGYFLVDKWLIVQGDSRISVSGIKYWQLLNKYGLNESIKTDKRVRLELSNELLKDYIVWKEEKIYKTIDFEKKLTFYLVKSQFSNDYVTTANQKNLNIDLLVNICLSQRGDGNYRQCWQTVTDKMESLPDTVLPFTVVLSGVQGTRLVKSVYATDRCTGGSYSCRVPNGGHLCTCAGVSSSCTAGIQCGYDYTTHTAIICSCTPTYNVVSGSCTSLGSACFNDGCASGYTDLWTCSSCNDAVCVSATSSSQNCGSTTVNYSCTNECGGTISWTGTASCKECTSCSPACGQSKDCGGTCGNTDDGAPIVPVCSNIGTVTSPAVTLSWSSGGVLTDNYQYSVGGGSTVTTTATSVSYSSSVAGSHTYTVRSVNTTCGTDSSNWATNCSWCYETKSCALACGQATDCSGVCSNSMNGGPTAPTLNAPYNGTLANPYSASGTTANLSWTSTSSLTDYYRVYLINNATNATVWSNTNVTGTSVTTGTLSQGVLYRWYVVPVNNTCTAYGGEDVGTASVNGYFMINTAPFIGTDPIVIISDPGTTTPGTIVPSEEMTGLGVYGNQICDTDFAGTRRVRFQVTVSDSDINGGSQIDAVYLRLNNSGNIPLTVGVSGINAIMVTTISGSGGATWGTTPVTLGTVGTNTRQITFWVNLGSAFPSATYSMDLRAVDLYGGDSGWVNSNRYLRVWDCQVALSGHMYDSSDQAAGAVCSTGVGFNVLAAPEMNYTQTRITRSGVLESTANAVSGNYYYGVGVTWGQTYLIQPNADLQASNVITRWVGNSTLCGPSNQIVESLVNPYSATPSLQVDFSAIRNQLPWFQVSGGGIFSKSQISEMVPQTCSLDASCKPVMTISSTSATNGLVAAPVITNDSGCSLSSGCGYGDPNNWSYANSIESGSFGYDYFYNNYFAKVGLGYTVPTNATMSQIVAGSGGTGVVLVDGNLNVDTNNTVAVGRFFMVITSGTISISQNVTRTEGILVADQGIGAGGTNDTQLRINGILYSPLTIRLSRGYTTQVNNNANPATLVAYRPDLLFNMPPGLAEALTSWSQGK